MTMTRIVQDGVLNAGITFSKVRASTATYFDSAGVLQTAIANEMRTDHDPVTKAVKGLVIEEARTNFIRRSETFSNANWSTTNLTVSDDQITAPDGSSNGDLLDDNTTSGGHEIYDTGSAVGIDTQVTWSIFIKQHTAGIGLQIRPRGVGSGKAFANFDPADGTVGNSGGTELDGTDSQDIGDGWYRVSMTMTPTGGTNPTCELQLVNDIATGAENLAYAGSASAQGVYVFGAQAEAGAAMSSYIVSEAGASVTRAADDISITDLSQIDYPGANNPYSLFVKYSFNNTYAQDGERVVWTIHSISSANRQLLDRNAATKGLWYGLGALGQSLLVNPVVADMDTVGFQHKFAGAVGPNDGAGTWNGAAVTTDSSLTWNGTALEAQIGAHWDGGLVMNGHILDLVYWDERLSNDTLEDYSLNGVPTRRRDYIAITRRTLKGPPKKRIFPKATKGLFR